MEACSIAHCCNEYNKKFLIIRSFSDIVTKKAMNWTLTNINSSPQKELHTLANDNEKLIRPNFYSFNLIRLFFTSNPAPSEW